MACPVFFSAVLVPAFAQMNYPHGINPFMLSTPDKDFQKNPHGMCTKLQ